MRSHIGVSWIKSVENSLKNPFFKSIVESAHPVSCESLRKIIL